MQHAEQAAVYEELFCLTLLAHVRCYAELGALPTARRELERGAGVWRTEACRIADQLLLGKAPERLIGGAYAKDVPIDALCRWMDFACGEQRGSFWIDKLRAEELRRQINRMKHAARRTLSGENTLRDQTIAIPALARIVARDDLLEGY